MKKELILVLLFLILVEISYAQIFGLVVDASNQNPLPAATVIYGDDRIAISDQEGNFSLSNINFPVTLKVTYVGYEPEIITLTEAQENLLIELKASNYMLGEIRVTALESDQNVIETPASVSMIARKELKQDNDAYVVPALNRVPGIFMHSGTYNTNRLTIRGIGSRSLFATTKIRAYYEDIPLTSGDGQTTIEDIDPNLIDRIEIIKGPSSSLYGAGLGGTLLIKPKVPTNKERLFRYQITGGSFGYLKNAFTFDLGTRKHRISMNINNTHSDGWRENNQFDRLSSGIAYKAYLTDKTNLDVIASYIDLKAYIPSSLNRETFETNPQAAATNWKNVEGFEDYVKFLGGVGVNHQFNEYSGLNASLFWSYRDAYERTFFHHLDEFTNALGGRGKYRYTRNWSGWKLEFISGIEYFLDNYDWRTYEADEKMQGDLTTENEEDRENLNVFLKTDITLPTRTLITLGLNVNSTNYTYTDVFSVDSIDNSGDYQFGTTLSPRIGVNQPVTGKINTYINISHGFSPPTLAETLTPERDINPDIKPEKGMNYEWGVKGLANRDKLFFDLALFSMRINNLIVARRTGADRFVGVNAGKTVHNGIEATLNYNFLPPGVTDHNLFGFITYTLADYRFEEFLDEDNDYSGNDLTGIPANVMNAGLSFVTGPGIYGNVNFKFVDEMPLRDDNSVYSDPYHVWSAKAGYRKIIARRFEVDLYGIVDNIFDADYASMIMVNASSFGGSQPRYYYPGMPRNYYLGAEVSYHF